MQGNIDNNNIQVINIMMPPPSDEEVVCYLCLDAGSDDEAGGQSLRRNCACRGTDAGFVHSPASRIMPQPRVSRLVIRMHSEIRGEFAQAAIKNIKTSLLSISPPSLSRSSEGSIQTIHKSRWKLFI